MGIVIKQLKKGEIDDFKNRINTNKHLSDHSPFLDGSLEEFRWQFFSDSPNKSLYFLAIDDVNNELIGTMAALVIPMQMPNGEVGLTIKPEDVLLSIRALVKYKGRDILKELLEAIEKGTESKKVKFYWGFTEATSAFIRLGFSKEFSSQQGILVFKMMQAYNHLINLNSSNGLKQKILILGLSTIAYIKSSLIRKKTKSFICKEISFDEINEDILLSFLPSNMYSLSLNKDFLQWRILDNPSILKYHILQFENLQEEIIAYLIYSEKQKGVFFIEQFLYENTLSLDQKQKVTMSAVHHLKKKKASIIRTMGFTHNKINQEECEILRKIGFIYANKGIPFILKSKVELKKEDIYLSRLNTQGTF